MKNVMLIFCLLLCSCAGKFQWETFDHAGKPYVRVAYNIDENRKNNWKAAKALIDDYCLNIHKAKRVRTVAAKEYEVYDGDMFLPLPRFFISFPTYDTWIESTYACEMPEDSTPLIPVNTH